MPLNGCGFGPASALVRVDRYFAAPAQVLFVLALPPADPSVVMFFVNGQGQRLGVDYTVLGVNVTWLNTFFTLDGDDVEIQYTA